MPSPGSRPIRCGGGPLSPTEFLRIVTDLTTWSLTHFEPVLAWSLAEDLSAAEEQEGYGLIGRRRRLSAADNPSGHSLRTLQEVSEPKIRGSALWVAHALMSASHVGAPPTATPNHRCRSDKRPTSVVLHPLHAPG
jgi:hypothetical protein